MPSKSQPPSAGEYVVRIRYQPDLEAPQCPPKMVELPNSANASLLEPSHISSLARADSLCVDVDAELGMPIDLVHMAGVFDGNEACASDTNYSIHTYILTGAAAMRSRENNPPIHPRDRMLLRSVGQLGKHNAQATAGAAAASWLRRTEYISAEQSRSTFRGKAGSASRKSLRPGPRPSQKRKEDADPVRTLAAVLKGFDIANPLTAQPHTDAADDDDDATLCAARRAWDALVHPTKPHLRVVETFPLLPDMAATSDAGGYLVFQFATDPLAASRTRDTRMDVGLLKPRAETPDDDDDGADADADAEMPEHNFDFYLPASAGVAARIKRKLLAHGTADRRPREEFAYRFVRSYETKTHKTHRGPAVCEAALTFHAGAGARYYPVVGRYVLQPRRAHKFPPGMPLPERDLARERRRTARDGAGPPDVMRVTVRELSWAEKSRREEHAAGM